MGMINRRRVMEGKSLPYDYEVEWIGTNGNVCFITDFVPNTYDLTFKGSFVFDGYATSGPWLGWWSAYTNENSVCYRMIRYSNGNLIWMNNGNKGNGGGSGGPYVNNGDTVEFIFTPTQYIINGRVIGASTLRGYENTEPLIFFFPDVSCKMKGHFQCYKENDLIHEYIPVVKNGVGCLYDSVTDKIFYNTLNGNPTVGQKVTN